MASSTYVAIAHLAITTKDARDQVLRDLHAISENAKSNEPGLLKYAICLPDTSPPDETSIYVLEEFSDITAINQHMTSPLVTTLNVAFKDSDPPILQPTSNVVNVAWLPKATLSRNERLPSQLPKTTEWDLRNRVENPYILFAKITDPDPEDIDALEPYGAAIVEYATANEPDTIFYADARPKSFTEDLDADGLQNEKNGYICAWEVYATKQAAHNHLGDDSVRQLSEKGKELKSKFQVVPLIMQEGWLIRE